MPHFIFKAKKVNGEEYSGEKDVNDRFELYRLIHASGEELISVEETKNGKGLKMNIKLPAFLSKVKTIDKINFARNLGSMLEAGLPLSRALDVLEKQAHNKKFKDILAQIGSEISKGSTFADALSKYRGIFPNIFISMVHSGEQSGTLAESLKGVGLQMERAYALERRIKGALIYPAVIVFVMIVVAILMFTFVIPSLMKTFVDLKVKLPFMTQIILDMSNFVQDKGIFVLVGIIAIFVFVYFWSKKESGKKIIHNIILKLPIVGPLAQEVNTARTARTMSSLLNAGVNVLESVLITSDVIQNVHFKSVLKQAEDIIKKGRQMSEVFGQNTKLYPVFFVEMVGVGEETGKTAEMLLGVAKYYEEDVEQKTKDMSTVIEPILMIFIAIGVAFFAIAMISPMYSLVNAI
jgi:type IV pilus assembly protein PilC